MKIIKRNKIKEEMYRLILDTENHHNHKIELDENGVLRWLANKRIEKFSENKINEIIDVLIGLGYDKNSEIYRKFYRDIGYSLSGYWELFYWPVNNEGASKYRPNKK